MRSEAVDRQGLFVTGSSEASSGLHSPGPEEGKNHHLLRQKEGYSKHKHTKIKRTPERDNFKDDEGSESIVREGGARSYVSSSRAEHQGEARQVPRNGSENAVRGEDSQPAGGGGKRHEEAVEGSGRSLEGLSSRKYVECAKESVEAPVIVSKESKRGRGHLGREYCSLSAASRLTSRQERWEALPVNRVEHHAHVFKELDCHRDEAGTRDGRVNARLPTQLTPGGCVSAVKSSHAGHEGGCNLGHVKDEVGKGEVGLTGSMEDSIPCRRSGEAGKGWDRISSSLSGASVEGGRGAGRHSVRGVEVRCTSRRKRDPHVVVGGGSTSTGGASTDMQGTEAAAYINEDVRRVTEPSPGGSVSSLNQARRAAVSDVERGAREEAVEDCQAQGYPDATDVSGLHGGGKTKSPQKGYEMAVTTSYPIKIKGMEGCTWDLSYFTFLFPEIGGREEMMGMRRVMKGGEVKDEELLREAELDDICRSIIDLDAVGRMDERNHLDGILDYIVDEERFYDLWNLEEESSSCKTPNTVDYKHCDEGRAVECAHEVIDGSVVVSNVGFSLPVYTTSTNSTVGARDTAPGWSAPGRQQERSVSDLRVAAINSAHQFTESKQDITNKLIVGIRGRVSRNMKRHVARVESFGVMEKCHRSDSTLVMPAFTIPKKNEKLRLILDCRELNKKVKKPMAMKIPRIHDVIDDLMKHEVFAQSDGTSYFFQFPICERIRDFFSAKLGDIRGKPELMRFTRLPMGWSWAPAIAQRTSNVLVDGLGYAWVDNFIIFAHSEYELETRTNLFLQRCKEANVALSDYEMKGSAYGEVLGMEFDLRLKRYRMAPKWLEKMKEKPPWKAVSNNAATRREIMAVLGGCIWQAHVTKTKLWHHHEAVDVLRDIAGDSPEMLDERYEVPARKLQKITEWMVVVGENKWTQWSPAAEKEATLWSDASDDTWAFVIEKDGVILDFKRGDCSKTDILVSETIVSQGLKAARKESRGHVLWVIL